MIYNYTKKPGRRVHSMALQQTKITLKPRDLNQRKSVIRTKKKKTKYKDIVTYLPQSEDIAPLTQIH